LLKLKRRVAALKLIPSSGGVFEVIVNGEKIYSKIATGEFPDAEALVQKVRNLR
jgi:selenoprotein W-related protein